ncbi:MAG: condensation domain-containing protein, partial [Bacteroidota bacterium]
LAEPSNWLPEQSAYRLNYMQEAFLMHHLRESRDEGFLQLIFTLKGTLDRDLFQKAWEMAKQRHIAMRSSIQWRDREKPEQVIHAEAALTWTFLDWREQSTEQQTQALATFQQTDAENPLDLSQAPLARMALIQLSEDRYELFWTCHHILLDGWSGGIVLKDALQYYEANDLGQAPQLDPIPTYATYVDWKSKQDEVEAKAYWQKRLMNVQQTPVWNAALSGTDEAKPHFGHQRFVLTQEQSEQLRQLVRQHRVTLPTVLQSLWGLVLGHYFKTDDVVFGTTVSGRFVDFPGIEQMAGLFMNVLPTRVSFAIEESITDWLVHAQAAEADARPFEHITVDQIGEWIDWPAHLELFDCLFVYGNFLKDGLAIGTLEVENFRGGFTSSYPLTLRVNPLKGLVFDWRYDTRWVADAHIEWMQTAFQELLNILLEKNPKRLSDLTEVLPSAPKLVRAENQTLAFMPDEAQYLAPRNETELQLSKIWESLLDVRPIGVKDHFFAIGGRSLQAIQLFARIEEQFDRRLPAVSLFEHPTIEALAALISGDQQATTDWSSLVPLRSGGNKAPLFCFHAGGGHVFFYKGLAMYLNVDRPVYAIQPKGIDGGAIHHQTIESMANDYIEEIQQVQPQGPYHLLGTCFSNAVGLEVANQLAVAGEEVALLAIIDSGPAHLIPVSPNGERKPLRRFARLLQRGDWKGIVKKLRNRWIRYQQKINEKNESEEERNLRLLVDNLNRLYQRYTWQQFPGKITFIRSKEFAERKDKKYHLQQWSKLAGGGLEVHVVPGHHQTLFEEPEIGGLVEQLAQCLEILDEQVVEG